MDTMRTFPADPSAIVDPLKHAEIRTPHALIGIEGCFWRVNGPDGRPLARAVHMTVPGDGPMGWLVRRDDGRVLLTGGSEEQATACLIGVAVDAVLAGGWVQR